jgi:hypothetical protein
MIGGYAREDADVACIVAVLTDEEKARKLSKVIFGSSVDEVELNVIPPGYVEHAKMFGLDLG